MGCYDGTMYKIYKKMYKKCKKYTKNIQKIYKKHTKKNVQKIYKMHVTPGEKVVLLHRHHSLPFNQMSFSKNAEEFPSLLLQECPRVISNIRCDLYLKGNECKIIRGRTGALMQKPRLFLDMEDLKYCRQRLPRHPPTLKSKSLYRPTDSAT